ncbi:MAG: transcription elongation factor GreA [Actinomycetota bacterium]|jgi:transcription elongation factor GreA
MAKHHLSRAAFERLTAEHYDLTTRGRIQVAEKIETARLLGDLSENGDYHAAKDEQGHMEGRIRHLEHLLDPENHEIVEVNADGSIGPGSVVTILYEGDDEDMAERYLIGHPEEQTESMQVMSPNSPLGTALLGKAEGDIVEYKAPNGTLRVRILEVEAGA